MKDWGPFLLLWITYDLMRGIADNLSYIHVKEVYYLELFLFGWLFGGQIPSFWFRHHTTVFLDVTTGFIYTLHMAMPVFVAGLIYYVSDNKALFKRFTYTFLLCSYMALVTFAIYPVAPPWYVATSGFRQPHQLVGIAESAAGLVRVDHFFHNNFYGSFYQTFNSNPFAAVPSLHSAYSFMTAYFFIISYRDKSKWVYLALIYPSLVWFSAVYLQHHYIVDLIAGVVYVLIADFISTRYRTWRQKRKDNKSESIDITVSESISGSDNGEVTILAKTD